MRRSFDEVLLLAKVNISKEYSRLYDLFFKKETAFFTMYNYLDTIFTSLHLPGTCLSLEDFNEDYGFIFEEIPNDLDADYLINFCEYCYNLCFQYKTQCSIDFTPCNTIINQVEYIIEKIGYQKTDRNSFIIFVPKDSATICASEIVNEELSPKLLEYNHHSLCGNLSGKKEILRKMAHYIEPRFKKLNGINSSLKTDLSYIFNNFDIRHNNKYEGKYYNPILEKLTDNELERIYDDAYQMWLLSILELDNIERKDRVEALKNA